MSSCDCLSKRFTPTLCDRCSDCVVQLLAGKREYSYECLIPDLEDGMWTGCGICTTFLEALHSVGPSDRYDYGDQEREVDPSQFKIQAQVYSTLREGRLVSIRTNFAVPGGLLAKIDKVFTTYEDDPAAPFVSTRLVKAQQGPGSSAALARQWLDTCLQQHNSCRFASVAPPYGIRALDVQSLPGFVRLRTLDNSEIEQYVALSYCWGGEQENKLTTTNFHAYEHGMSLEHLPKTIKHAAEITQALGLRYLWVDSLCILQDLKTDKSKQISQMSQIFQNCTVAIVATGESVQTGFLRDSDITSLPSFRLPVPGGGDGTLWLRSEDDGLSHWPIERRGWCLEERLLSPRLLIFPTAQHQIGWLCNQCSLSNTKEADLGSYNWLRTIRIPRELRTSKPTRHPKKMLQAFWFWAWIVGNYSRREITEPQDKLRAVGGLAAVLAPYLGQKYHAGLWEYNLLHQLLWVNYGFIQIPVSKDGLIEKFEANYYCTKPEQYRAPSWSWASVDGQTCVIPWPLMKDVGTKVLRCSTVLRDQRLPFGAVTDGSIMLRGRAVQASIRYNRTAWPNRWQLIARAHSASDEGFVASFVADTPIRKLPRAVWCIAIGKIDMEQGSSEGPPDAEFDEAERLALWDPETGIKGLVLVPVRGRKAVYTRIGIFELDRLELYDGHGKCFCEGPRQDIEII